MLDSLEIGDKSANACVIWMHGLGADGYDFVPVVEELALPPTVRFVFPHAPVRPVTLNGGYQMPAWYDLYSLTPGGPQDESGIRAAAGQVNELIARENARGISAQRIVLAGFSQGGALALQTALRHEVRLAGLLALSTYVPLSTTVAAECSDANRSMPIFMAHGDNDTVIAPGTGRAGYQLLADLGYPAEWHEYAMAHSLCQQEIGDIRRFLLQVLNLSVTIDP